MSAERSRDSDEPDDEISGARATPVDPLIGARIADRYRIVRVHGRGGMSIVYAATYEAQQREVAIKVLDEDSSNDPLAIERFMHEARTASSLSHGHVVGVSDFGRLPNGRPYLVMPMIQGKDLATLISEEGPMPASRVAALLAGVASALDSMHEQGLIHRDIKSENLMFVRGDDGTETVLVLDFGIAAAPQGSSELEDDGTSGTPDFMAPEALAGEPLDHRADVYSLATVAFELLSASLPFESTDVADLARIKTTQRPRTLSEATRTKFPAALEAVIARGLARDPNNRPRSAGKLVQALSVAAANAKSTLQAPWVKALAERAAAVASATPAPKPESKPPARKRTLVGQPITLQAAAALAAQAHAKSAAPPVAGPDAKPVAQAAAKPVAQPALTKQTLLEVAKKPAQVLTTGARPPVEEPSIVVDPSLFAEAQAQAQTPAPRVLQPAPRVLPPVRSVLEPRPSAPRPIDSMSPLSELEVEPPRMGLPWLRIGIGVAAALGALVIVLSLRDNDAQSSVSATQLEAPATAPSQPPVAELAPKPAPSPVHELEIAPAPAPSPMPSPVPAAEPTPAPAPAAEKSVEPKRAPKTSSRSRTTPATREPRPTRAVREPAPAAPAAERASAQDLSQAAVDAMLRGDFEGALAQFKAAISANPRYAPAHRGKGLVLERMGRAQDAASAFKQYLRLQPTAPDAAKIKARLAALE
jgi:serine/threonine-protein kinase